MGVKQEKTEFNLKLQLRFAASAIKSIRINIDNVRIECHCILGYKQSITKSLHRLNEILGLEDQVFLLLSL